MALCFLCLAPVAPVRARRPAVSSAAASSSSSGRRRRAFSPAAAPLVPPAAAPIAESTGVELDLELPRLDEELLLDPAHVLEYERNGYALTRGLFDSDDVESLKPHLKRAFEAEELAAIKQKILVVAGKKAYERAEREGNWRQALARIPQEHVPFLQGFNLWRRHGAVRALAHSRRLASVAAQLLGARRVRLYQDSMFLKRPGDGPTNWHSDLTMAPFDTNDVVTAWIPLTPVPKPSEGGTQLVYAARSHRDFALHFWHGAGGDLSGRYREFSYGALAIGDATWHHGWTLHYAPGNATKEARLSIAVTFLADGAKLLPKSSRKRPEEEDASSYSDWIRDLKPGGFARHPLLPIVYDGFADSGGSKP
eukprot:tig00000293_g23891.t1